MAVKISQRTIKLNTDLSVEKDIDDFVLEETKKLGKGILQKVVRRTPYRTGQAKRNWLVSENVPDTDFITIPEESPLPIVTAENAALTEGYFKINNVRVYNLVYIQDNAPYIVRLNNGYSLQAPSLYVDTAILEEVNKR